MTSVGCSVLPIPGVVLMAVLIAPSGAIAVPPTPRGEEPTSRVRRPVALALSGDGSALLVANRRSGTISVIDLPSRRRIAEHEIARGLSDLVPFPDGIHFAAIDPEAGELLLLEHRPERLAVRSRLSLSPDPIHVAILPGGTACVVTSRWGRRLTIVDIELGEGAKALTLRRSLNLPFSPREVLSLGKGKALLVADAFGGKLAVVDPSKGTLCSVREIPGHNLRGLTLAQDGSTVVLARQLSSRLATSSFDDVHWGNLMKNQVLTLRSEAIFDSEVDLLRGSSARDLDEVGHAAGDPEDLALDPKGQTVVALAGVGELAVLSDLARPIARVPAGTRPSSTRRANWPSSTMSRRTSW